MTKPLLFGKRRPLAVETAVEYVGTDTEMDIKDGVPGQPPEASSK